MAYSPGFQLSRPKSRLPSHDVQIHCKFPLIFPSEGWTLEWGGRVVRRPPALNMRIYIPAAIDEARDNGMGAHIY